MSKKVIYLEDAIDALKKAYWSHDIQSAKDDPCIVDAMTDWAIRQIKALPSAQKTCRWTNKGVFYGDDVDAWQECECSKCGRWDTRPYMYYFDEPNYCSYCGAKRQKGEKNEAV